MLLLKERFQLKTKRKEIGTHTTIPYEKKTFFALEKRLEGFEGTLKSSL